MFQFTYPPGRIIVDDPIIISTLFFDLKYHATMGKRIFLFPIVLDLRNYLHLPHFGHVQVYANKASVWKSEQPTPLTLNFSASGWSWIRKINGITRRVSMCACPTNSGLWGMNAVGEEYLRKWHVLNAHINVYCWGKNSHLSWTHDHQLSGAVPNKLPIQ